MLWVLICTVHLTVCSYHVTYAFHSEHNLYSYLNVNDLSAQIRGETWSLTHCNATVTHNHIVRKRTLKHLAKETEWMSRVVSTYLYGAFDCMFLSCHIRLWDLIHTIYLPECQGTLCWNQLQNLKISDDNSTRTHNNLVPKQTLNLSAKLAK